MSARDIRSASPRRSRISALLEAAGFPSRRTEPSTDAFGGCEQLEPRVMLSGDHPSLQQVYLGTTADPVLTNGTAAAGVISPAGDNDVFTFTPTQTDFVRVWADALNAAGSPLDSSVQVYTRLDQSQPFSSTNSVLVAAGANNGTLTSGVFKDGWAGFIGQANQQYWVQVFGDTLTGAPATGGYNLRVNAGATAFPALDPTSGQGQIAGNIALRGGDVVYKVTTGAGALFNGLMMINAIADATQLDTRLDVYDSAGNPLRFPNNTAVIDDDSGNLSNSYLAFKASNSTVYYIRVRSDQKAVGTAATGAFTLLVDGIGNRIDVDPVTRLANLSDSLADQTVSNLYVFQAQGTGWSFLTLSPNFQSPNFIPDTALRLYDDTGVQIAFNELPGPSSQILRRLEGGRTYYMVIENFDGNAGGDYIAELEVHHTFDNTAPAPTPIQDDHASTPDPALPLAERRRQFEQATPLLWSNPQDYVSNWPGPPAAPPPGDRSKVVLTHASGRIFGGGDTDLFQFVPPVDMLSGYGGLTDGVPPPPMGVGPAWLPQYVPATRLQVIVGSTAVGFVNTRVQVYDSNFTLLWTNDTIVAGQPDPAGMWDPASFPPASPAINPPLPPGQPDGIPVWGGEVYYLEVSATAGAGRYTVELQADAPVLDNAASPDNVWDYALNPTLGGSPPPSSSFTNATDIDIDPNSGDARNFSNVAGGTVQETQPGSNIWFATTGVVVPPDGATNPSYYRLQAANRLGSNNNPPFPPPISGTGAATQGLLGTPGTSGRAIFEMGDLGNIRTIDDTQVYKFRALYTGTAEIRIDTTQITDGFFSGLVTNQTNDPASTQPPPPATTTITARTKTYDSPLDAALRVFDNDFQQVAFNNDNSVSAGETSAYTVGSFANKTFYQRDPRAVIHVEAGKEYYIQVESGQARLAANPDTVDWRHATGSFELLINSMPNLFFSDDHADGTVNEQGTPIPVDLSATSTAAVLGAVDGQINFAGDSDVFIFISPNAGTATFSAVTRGGDQFQRTITVIDAGTGATVGSATGNGAQAATLNVLALKGQKFFVSVTSSIGNAQGRYTVRVSGVPFHDAVAGDLNFGAASVINANTYDYDKTETVSGRIDNPGDTDAFSFQSLTFDVATITVHSRSGNFNPFFRVYEISEDPDGNPIRLQIGSGTGTAIVDATTDVSVTAPRTSLSTGHTFTTYYVVVSGVDPDGDFGDYDLSLTMNVATDDHPDLNQPALARDPEDTITIGGTGTGGGSGSIEISGDTDIFQFNVAAGGTVTLNVVSPQDSRLRTTVRVFDAAGTPITDLGTGGTTVVGPDDPQSIAPFTFLADRNATYYVVVGGQPSPGAAFKPDDHGTYLVNITTPVPDDHPNQGEFNIADPIFIAGTGQGAAVGTLEVGTDSDLFTFTALGDGNAVITIGAPSSGVTPELRLYDPSTGEIGAAVVDGGPGDEDPTAGSVRRTIQVVTGSAYYILVTSNPQATGGYNVSVDSPRPINAPPDDHANAGDWPNATPIPLNPQNGDGTGTGLIEVDGDTDLFFFNSLSGSLARARQAFVQVITPNGTILDAGVRIFNAAHQELTNDTAGGPGFNAGVSFNIDTANQKYFVEVDGLSGTGAYTVKVDTAPETYTLYYPEGFSNNNIREYIVVENPNSYSVQYTVKIRYETTGAEVVLADHVTLGQDTRGGISISDGPNGRLAGVEVNHGYSIIIESDGFIAANISHYDFHATLGEAFTSRTSNFWSFARGDRQPGVNADFVIVYNPNPTPVVATFTAFKADGSTFQMTQTIAGFTRGGWTLAGTPALGVGQFGFTVTSAPATPGDPDIGVVASLSHYDLVNRTGYGALGNPDGGSTTGIVPGVITGGSVTTTVTLFNTSSSAASVSIVGKYLGAGLPDITKLVTIAANNFVTLSGVDLGLTANQLAGLRYDSTAPLTVLGGTIRPGSTPPDATTDITQANTEVATSWFFGDAFINRIHAGDLYQENMYLYNPDVNPLTVTLKFLFDDGFTSSIDVAVGGKDFAAVALHTLPQILNHKVFNFFSVEAFANGVFAAKMNHYDLVLDGAWGTKGAPLGLTNPLT